MNFKLVYVLALSITIAVIAKKCRSCKPVYMFGFILIAFCYYSNRLVASFFIGNSAQSFKSQTK